MSDLHKLKGVSAGLTRARVASVGVWGCSGEHARRVLGQWLPLALATHTHPAPRAPPPPTHTYIRSTTPRRSAAKTPTCGPLRRGARRRSSSSAPSPTAVSLCWAGALVELGRVVASLLFGPVGCAGQSAASQLPPP
jgi:hypothetical protein